VKVLYRQTASDDIVRQFRYCLVTAEAPEIALRFREAVRRTIQSLGHFLIDKRCAGPAWPALEAELLL